MSRVQVPKAKRWPLCNLAFSWPGRTWRGILRGIAVADPIVIYRSADREGATFALKPSSRERLHERFGSAVHIRSRVFIAHETRADYEAVHSNLASQVVQLLTGLSEERLQEFGGVAFRDPETEADIPRFAA
jgi:hypothetical protein